MIANRDYKGIRVTGNCQEKKRWFHHLATLETLCSPFGNAGSHFRNNFPEWIVIFCHKIFDWKVVNLFYEE